jgi:hypothetical protein
VHWVARQEAAANAEEATEKTYAWNERKRMFRADHIRRAWEVLDRKGWLSSDS